jgi:hypothetical protein
MRGRGAPPVMMALYPIEPKKECEKWEKMLDILNQVYYT